MMSTYSREAALFHPDRGDCLELVYFAGKKYLKIDWSVKMPLHWQIMGVACMLSNGPLVKSSLRCRRN